LIRQFPEPKTEKNSVTDVTIRIDSVGKPERIIGMEVIFVIEHRRIERSEQYRNWKSSLKESTESFTATWSGILKNDNSVTMTGIFSVPERENIPSYYSEEQRKMES
jgi:hypothetical protein